MSSGIEGVSNNPIKWNNLRSADAEEIEALMKPIDEEQGIYQVPVEYNGRVYDYKWKSPPVTANQGGAANIDEDPSTEKTVKALAAEYLTSLLKQHEGDTPLEWKQRLLNEIKWQNKDEKLGTPNKTMSRDAAIELEKSKTFSQTPLGLFFSNIASKIQRIRGEYDYNKIHVQSKEPLHDARKLNLELLDKHSLNELRVHRDRNGVLHVKLRNPLERLTKKLGFHDIKEEAKFAQLFRDLAEYSDLPKNGVIRTQLVTIFPKRLPEFQQSPFNKTHKMPKALQNALFDRLVDLDLDDGKSLENLRAEKTQDDFVDSPEHQFESRLAKTKLAKALGFGIKGAKGATGTVWLTDINGKPMHVFKSADNYMPFSVKIKQWFKANSPFAQLFYLPKHRMAQPRAEVAAYQAAETFGFNAEVPGLVQIAKEVNFDNKDGVAQLFVKNLKDDEGKKINYHETQDVAQDLDNPNSDEDLTKIQLFFLFDFLLGNLDRHGENAFFTVKKTTPTTTSNENLDIVAATEENFQGKTEILGINTIDNANSFPIKNPRGALTRPKNQYQWKDMEISKEGFTREVKDFVKNNLTEQNVTIFIDQLKAIMKEGKAYNPKMEKRFRERVKAIHDQIKYSPHSLAAFFSKTEFDRLR